MFIVLAVPIVYILLTVPGLMPWEDPEFRFLSWCHLVGSVAPWIGSFVYHLFMNLERGENIYYRLLQLDMLGIWISQSFGKCLLLFYAKGREGNGMGKGTVRVLRGSDLENRYFLQTINIIYTKRGFDYDYRFNCYNYVTNVFKAGYSFSINVPETNS